MTVFDEFNTLKSEMEQFSQMFEANMIKKRTSIINNKENHVVKLNDLSGKEQTLTNEINQFTQKKSKIKETIKKSLEDLQVQSIKVEELRTKHAELVRKRDEIRNHIDEINNEITNVSSSIDQSKTDLEEQNAKDYPELVKYESYLGLRIEVVEVDLLKFIFQNIDPNDYNKEVWCELSVGGSDYKIGKTSPELSTEIIKSLEDDFNDHKELIKFLKTTRETLRDA